MIRRPSGDSSEDDAGDGRDARCATTEFLTGVAGGVAVKGA